MTEQQQEEGHLPLWRLGFPGGSVAKNPPVMQETQVQSLSQEDPLAEEWQSTPKTETYAAAAVDLQHPLKEFRLE